METLACDLQASAHRDFSLLLYGPPGTGKSAYLRVLADRLGLEVMFRRASSILDKYVGGSEANVAAIFHEAREREMFLLLDECDSMLRDRKLAERSWEGTLVDELLSQMEDHPFPFAMTTNLIGTLDEASKRRFVYKVECGFMTPDQVRRAFRVFFDCAPPESLKGLDRLTPGDFAVVRKQTKFRRTPPGQDEIVYLLKAEIAAKGPKSNPIGFGAEIR